MSLIIAIEPDRDQAAQLKDLVRRHTGAELILADTTAHAIGVMGERVPDLVLIPAFLSPEDDEALTAALRVTEAAAHVQTLTIPLLGEPQQKSAAQGVLSRLRWDQPRPSSPDSCDPKLFAEQISEYLQRVAQERGTVAGTNGKGSHGSNGAGRNTVAAAAAKPTQPAAPAASPAGPPAAMTTTSAAPAKPASAREAADKAKKSAPAKLIPPEPLRKEAIQLPQSPTSVLQTEVTELDVSALEAALADVTLDTPASAEAAVANDSADPKADPSLAPEEIEGLEAGLSSLMERLTNEDSTVLAEPVAPAPAETTDWAELKQLESMEYAIPKIIPTIDQPSPANTEPRPSAPPPAPDLPAAPVQQAAPAQAQEPPAAVAPATAPPAESGGQPAPSTQSVASEWGDLMESLKKDLGR